jgi:hypothetical protein
MSCPITGDAYASRKVNIDGDHELNWVRADPKTHITVELLAELDDAGSKFLDAMYEVGELCPHQPGNRHARRRDTLEQP